MCKAEPPGRRLRLFCFVLFSRCRPDIPEWECRWLRGFGRGGRSAGSCHSGHRPAAESGQKPRQPELKIDMSKHLKGQQLAKAIKQATHFLKNKAYLLLRYLGTCFLPCKIHRLQGRFRAPFLLSAGPVLTFTLSSPYEVPAGESPTYKSGQKGQKNCPFRNAILFGPGLRLIRLLAYGDWVSGSPDRSQWSPCLHWHIRP